MGEERPLVLQRQQTCKTVPGPVEAGARGGNLITGVGTEEAGNLGSPIGLAQCFMLLYNRINSSGRNKGIPPPASHMKGQIPRGRGPSTGKIQHSRPGKLYASYQLRKADYSSTPTDNIRSRFAGTCILDLDYRQKEFFQSTISILSTSFGVTAFFNQSSIRGSKT